MKDDFNQYFKGTFNFLALYPFAAKVSIKIPDRSEEARLNDLSSLLNNKLKDDLKADPPLPLNQIENIKLTDIFDDKPFFPKEKDPKQDLKEIFKNSPFAKWSSVLAVFNHKWHKKLESRFETLPLGVIHDKTDAKLYLYNGGIAVLALKLNFTTQTPNLSPVEFFKIIRETGEKNVRYENLSILTFCKTTLDVFGIWFKKMAGEGVFENYQTRDRENIKYEYYPTIITEIDCNSNFHFTDSNIEKSEICNVMDHLDKSEIKNSLPTFERDFIAIGYDSVWWLKADSVPSDGKDFRERVDLTFQYLLSISALIYVLQTEIDGELKELRKILSPKHSESIKDKDIENKRAQIRSLWGEFEDLLKEISLEAFSTWISDIFLLKSIRKNWLVDDSIAAFKDKIKSADYLLNEHHQEMMENQQRHFTKIGVIFAAAGFGSLIIATITLFFTENHWESSNPTYTAFYFFFKLLVVILLIAPFTFVFILKKWYQNIYKGIFSLFETNNDES